MRKRLSSILYNSIFRKFNDDNINVNENKLRQFPYEIEVVAENLYVPWAIAIGDDGTILVTERIGRIRIIKNDILQPQPLMIFSTPFVSQGEGGLMGIAIDPDYSQNHYIYVMHSYGDSNLIYNRVVRLLENNNSLIMERIIIDKIPGGRIHNGGRLKIGPDHKLYITTGDAGNSSLAQDPFSTAGKILRIELDGSIPKDNPFPNSPIYSLGHRNPQGLAWNSKNILYESEHGQSAHDEINIIIPGVNYGWPLVQGDEESVEVVTQKSLIHSGEETWAPSGISLVKQGPWKGKLLVAALRGQQLFVISLNRDGTEVNNIESFLKNEYGRLREVVEGKDGSVYLTTSNMDGRGNPNIGDDKILRLIPR
ncbi:PQQ-dependent sugar dehydrogenase [Clostridium chromiireducens]|uniref:PQQ-dependent sugar dehydrogenase n=1 Tax=Clostridium chromiireducens TaxID=225345 RepID=A0A399IQ38_9CLOT|nr:PQQ-dependent sugar dehydrogenase [Clostridium chromiireducens]RII34439.1 PQQ-dependent sugar dehydrogenase [Clostridium chromiireducens]